MENDLYNWKIVKTITRKIIKLVDLKDSSSSDIDEETEHKIKIISRKTFKKRKVFDLWYDKIIIPDDLISDTVKFNCTINGKISVDELFKTTTIDDLTPLFVIKLNLNPSNLEESLKPKIDKIYSIIERNGAFLTLKNIEDKNDIFELNSNKNTLKKLSVLCINPNIM